MSDIYGGDEINGLVLDLGTHTCKAGYSGDDMPKAVFPSACGVLSPAENGMEVDGAKVNSSSILTGQAAMNYRRDNMEVKSPFNADGILSEWDLVEALWEHAFKTELRVSQSDFGVMIAEPTHNTKEAREKTVELMFEKFDAPALFLARNAALSSFATARQTSVVVEAGHTATTVSTVQDGFVLLKSINKSPIGGQALTKCMLSVLESKAKTIRPRYSFKRVAEGPGVFKVDDIPGLEKTSNSYREFQVDQIAADVKESLCRVSEALFTEEQAASAETASYELPDGTEISVGRERFEVPEAYFQPELLSKWGPELEALKSMPKLQDLVMNTIQKCDVDSRKELYTGIVLTGGSSLLPGMRDRLEREMVKLGPQNAKVKVTMPANTIERRFGVWIGGSILASLGSFHQMWMSKKEYEEAGASMITRKCP